MILGEAHRTRAVELRCAVVDVVLLVGLKANCARSMPGQCQVNVER